LAVRKIAIEVYARHNGHAELLRESVDGASVGLMRNTMQ
jgi:hypothetical protein